MDRADITQIVLEAYESQWLGDFDRLLSCFDPQVRLTVAGDAAAFPFAGQYLGHEGLKDYLQRLDLPRRFAVPQLEDLLVDGGRAVVRWAAPLRATGELVLESLRFFDVVTVRDDRIVSLEQFPDTAAAAAAFSTAALGEAAAAQ